MSNCGDFDARYTRRVDDARLLAALRERASDLLRSTDCTDVVVPRLFPPIDTERIEVAERALGFHLPALLVEIFTTVGNGGFGPSYGLLGLQEGALDDLQRNALGVYASFRTPDPNDPLWNWPEQLLPIGQLGCAMYACVDCSSNVGPVVWFEPNPHEDGNPWDDSFIALAPSLNDWLSSWLAGEGVFDRVLRSDDH